MALSSGTPTALSGRLVTGEGIIDDGMLRWNGSRITEAGAARGGAPAEQLPDGYLILPGLIDLHCHGAGGGDFTSGSDADIEAAAAHLHRSGSTTFLASTCAAPLEDLEAAFGRLAAAADAGLIAGIHAEGPFLSKQRNGAHDPAFLLLPTQEDVSRLVTSARGRLASMTYAPELPGSDVLVYELVMHGVIPSIGHTDATTEETGAALDLINEELASTGFAGFSGRPTATHLFNAMPVIHHRSPGPAPLLLQRARAGEIAVELIADNVHLHPETVRMAFTIAGPENICLVSDSTAAAGRAAGTYRLGHREVTVIDGAAVLLQGGALAGGAGSLLDVVRCTMAAGVGVVDAVRAATAVPAVVLGLADEVGSLRAGLRADAVVVSPELELKGVLRDGVWIRPLEG
ncbi:N-acetylglucosamine-6-phosphate deacetylase [Arthrobacter pityocampae]|uniref:N-acetylglucosamine-6-phosphate deacetylase n=1 Tax=Arthrobacter pityocampae TaxID=547334 RepID=A0A2S5J1K4_9MICC|nr:amidohydrolase family protein [Arthrobacter pityocampae]PPB50677.1 N-acetylglucosamine-6-phosphate deacetylase [Arthrobacter pityocampae]